MSRSPSSQNVKAVGSFVLAGISLIGSIVLYAIGENDGAASILISAGTFGGYAAGRYAQSQS